MRTKASSGFSLLIYKMGIPDVVFTHAISLIIYKTVEHICHAHVINKPSSLRTLFQFSYLFQQSKCFFFFQNASLAFTLFSFPLPKLSQQSDPVQSLSFVFSTLSSPQRFAPQTITSSHYNLIQAPEDFILLPMLAWDSQCIQDWPPIYDPPASASSRRIIDIHYHAQLKFLFW